MLAWNAQIERDRRSVARSHTPSVSIAGDPPITTGVLAERNDLERLDRQSRQDAGNARIVSTGHQRAARHDLTGEAGERLVVAFLREEIGMIEFDVGDDGDVGMQGPERTVVLVCLDHDLLALGPGSVRSAAADDRSDEIGWIDTQRIERGDQHAGGRRLAMRSGNRDGGLLLRQQTQAAAPA